MKGITWSRDSHGLFDYESRHLTKNTMKTTHTAQIRRKVNDIELVPLENGLKFNFQEPMSDQQSELKPLLNILNENGKSRIIADTFYIESVVGMAG